MLGSLKKLLFCCHRKRPQWLQHLLYQCTTNKASSPWCSVFLDNFSFLCQYDPQICKTVKQCYESRQNIQSVMDTIYQDISKQNVLYSTIGLFSSYVRMQYSETINPTQITINRVKKDYEEFCKVMKECVVLYYDLDKIEGLFEELGKKSFMNLVVELLFDNDDFYETVGQLQRKVEREASDKIQFNMQKYQSLRAEEYGISAQYCLDVETLKLYGKESEVITEEPYSRSITTIREIVKERYPYEKLKMVQKVISSIESSISEFYTKHGIKQKQALNADSLISILVFILIQSKQGNLLPHLKLITHYLSKDLLSSSLGYSLSTLQACLKFIEKGSIKHSCGLRVSQSELSLWMNLQNYFEQITSTDL